MVAIRFEEFPRFAWSGVSSGNIAKRPVNLTVSIELSVFCISHLAYSVMTAILCHWIPVSILSIYQSYEASSL
jgi:hypothetical protein